MREGHTICDNREVISYPAPLGDDRWLFRGENANPPHQNTVGYWWRKARMRAGCPSTKLHDLRHFYASGLIAAGCDVVTVQRSLGHSSATVTLSTYAHLWPTAEDRTRCAADAILAEVFGPADERLTNDETAKGGDLHEQGLIRR